MSTIPLLNSRAVRTCVHRVRLDHAEPDGFVRVPPSHIERRRMEAGLAFEDDVAEQLMAALGTSAVDLREDRDEEETLHQMHRRAELIIGGSLPDDLAGGRTGIPDLLIHVGDGTYVPGDIKWHRVTDPAGKKTQPAITSPLDHPNAAQENAELKALGKDLWEDLAQLAHYTRMLQMLGFYPVDGTARGALIGVPPAGHNLAFTWFDLDAALNVTNEPVDPREGSALDLYDARHELRLRAATGQASTVPVRIDACSSCHWLTRCADDAGPGDASLTLAQDSLRARDWLALRLLGVSTTDDLAELDTGNDILVRRFARSSSTPTRGAAKLAAAVESADMLRTGELLRRTVEGPLEVPAADVEIDIDYEWDPDGRVYLWGGSVRLGPSLSPAPAEGIYWHASTFSALDADDEVALARRFVTWLRRVLAKAAERDRTVAIYHYTHPERTHLQRVLGDEADDVLAHFVDLHAWVKANFRGARGLSIKQVAPALGFTWRDADPGGIQSQEWTLRARETAHDAERERLTARVLAYNEDDVRAQVAIRDGARRAW